MCVRLLWLSHMYLLQPHMGRGTARRPMMAGVVSDRGNLSSRDAKQFDKMIAPLSGGSSIEK